MVVWKGQSHRRLFFMRGESTGRVILPSASPPSAGKAPMDSSTIPSSVGKYLCRISPKDGTIENVGR